MVATIPSAEHADESRSTLTRSDLLTLEPYKHTPYDTYKNAARRGAIDRVADPRSPRFPPYVRESVDRFLQQMRKRPSKSRDTDESDKAAGLPALLMDEITRRYPDVRPYEITAWTNACPTLPHGRIRSWPPDGSRGRRYVAEDVELAVNRKRAIKSGTPTKNQNLVYLDRILNEFPELSPELMQFWRKTEKIHWEECPLDSRKNLYDIEDVRRKLTEYAPAQTADRFDADGETWVWLGLLREKGMGVTQATIRRWEKKGCPYLAGEKPVVLHFKDLGTGSPNGRHYVTQSFLNRAEQGRQEPPPSKEKRGFITLHAAGEMGINKNLVLKYSSSNHPGRPKPGLSHPALERPIETHYFTRVTKRQLVHCVRYSQKDIQKILDTPEPPRDQWTTVRSAIKEYQILYNVLIKYMTTGGPLLDGKVIKSVLWPVSPTRSRPTEQKYLFRAHLAKLSAALHQSAPIATILTKGTGGERAAMSRKGGRPRTKDRLHEAHLFAHRIAKEFKNAKTSDGTSMKVFGARTRDLNQKFLGMKGMRRILAHVKRNPL